MSTATRQTLLNRPDALIPASGRSEYRTATEAELARG